MAKLILLDRDGVINFDSPESIRSAADWTPIPGSLQAIASLKRAGCKVGICSNQSGIGRGLFSTSDLAGIESRLKAQLTALDTTIDIFCYCPHHPDVGCDCRKPKPGMLQKAMRTLGIGPADTFFVGDSHRDLQAALAAGCRPVLVRTGNGQETLRYQHSFPDLLIFDDLASFAQSELDTESDGP